MPLLSALTTARSLLATPRRALFHELVHVEQYRLLPGIRPFAVQYVHGFLATGSYHEIPLKPCACQVEAEFVTGGAPFSVEERAASWRA